MCGPFAPPGRWSANPHALPWTCVWALSSHPPSSAREGCLFSSLAEGRVSRWRTACRVWSVRGRYPLPEPPAPAWEGGHLGRSVTFTPQALGVRAGPPTGTVRPASPVLASGSPMLAAGSAVGSLALRIGELHAGEADSLTPPYTTHPDTPRSPLILAFDFQKV